MAQLANMLTRTELGQLKAYVTAPGKLGANQADSTVLLHVTHSNLRAEFMELRFDKHVRTINFIAACSLIMADRKYALHSISARSPNLSV